MYTWTTSNTKTDSNRLNPKVDRGDANRLRPISMTGKSLFCRGFYQTDTLESDLSGEFSIVTETHLVYSSTDDSERVDLELPGSSKILPNGYLWVGNTGGRYLTRTLSIAS